MEKGDRENRIEAAKLVYPNRREDFLYFKLLLARGKRAVQASHHKLG